MHDGTPGVAVVGGGVAGLAMAVRLRDLARRADVPLRVTVFEKGDEPGGNLQTICQDGWQLEWGPNGFLDNEPATLRLVERLGLNSRLQRSSDAARRRFLLVDGRIQEIPTSPGAFMKSGLLSFGAKLRMAGELFIPPRKDLGRAAEDASTDETIHDFGVRRLGNEFAEVMLNPMVKGIFGGESRQLSLAAAFPRMVELERNYGGLFKAMMKLSRERKKKTDGGPTGTLHSFDGGMADLIEALVRELGNDPQAEILCDAGVVRIHQREDRWHVTADNGDHGPFDAVVEASPAHAAAAHLAEIDPEMGSLLAAIPFAPMAVIALGYARESVGHDLDGFGMLVPGRENRNLLGMLWTSSIFTGRAPEGMVLIRCMAGGAGNPGIMANDDEALTGLILEELTPLLDLKASPAMVKVIRHEKAIAQYVPGHLKNLARINTLASEQPGLFLSGSSYRGISVNACVKEAEKMAEEVLTCAVPAAGPASAEVSR